MNSNRFYSHLTGFCLLVVIAIALTSSAVAQTGTFKFGPPLRPNVVFAYKYTEHINLTQELMGVMNDSSDRTLSFYISQKMSPADGGKFTIEAIIDSMRLDYKGMTGNFTFNTQSLAGTEALVRHREVLAISSLVNRMVKFTLSSYGEVLSIQSDALDDLNKQALAVDQFTRERIKTLTTKEYLATVFLPWRVLPVAQKVSYDKEVRIPLWASLDLAPFHDVGKVTVMRPEEGATGPSARFYGELSHPVTKTFTSSAITEPMEMKSAKATLNGVLKLDDGGTVQSGWSALSGTINAEYEGREITARVKQEVYVELIGEMPL